MTYHNLKGWLLDATAQLDLHSPGFAGHVLRASDERRHVVAALLSVTPPDAFNLDLGRRLQCQTHDELITMAFGSNPPGYRRALGRAGEHIQPRRYYRYLWAIFSSTERRQMARVVKGLKRVTWPRLKVVRALPADVRHPNLIDAISDVREARDLGRAVQLLASNGASRAEMAEALTAVRSSQALSNFARRWATRVEFPPHPVPESECYHPIVSGDQLSRTARRFQNCAREHVVRVLEGRSAFAEFQHAGAAAVVHLVHDRAGWKLEDVYGMGNATPDAELEDSALHYLGRFGLGRISAVRVESQWASLRRLMGHLEYRY